MVLNITIYFDRIFDKKKDYNIYLNVKVYLYN